MSDPIRAGDTVRYGGRAWLRRGCSDPRTLDTDRDYKAGSVVHHPCHSKIYIPETGGVYDGKNFTKVESER